MYPLSLSSRVMHRVSTALHLHVIFDDITRHLANCNDDYKFSACPYSVSQEFAFEIEVMVTSYSEVVREIHVRHTDSYKVIKIFAFIIDELNVPWAVSYTHLTLPTIYSV